MRSYHFAVAINACLLTGCASGAPEQTDAVVIPNTVQHTVRSDIINRTFSVQVALPQDYGSTTDPYPVLYMLDANGQFGIVVDIVRAFSLLPDRLELPELVVVGIAYEVPSFHAALGMRTADLTPTRDTVYERMWREEWDYLPPIDRATGGGPDLLRFVAEELAPQMEAAYRIDTADRGLLGHSFGGQFALFAFLNEPGFFSRYLAVSPSLWWNCHPDTSRCWGEAGLPGYFFQREAEVRELASQPEVRLFVAVGLDETPHMVAASRRLRAVLTPESYPSLEWTLTEFEGDTHMSVVPGAISKGLRWLYADKMGQ